ncbi:MAG: hypothetical protein ACOX6Y_06645 [Christensenellales bacterium]
MQDRPGITRAAQWIKAGDRLELLDHPRHALAQAQRSAGRPPPGLYRGHPG